MGKKIYLLVEWEKPFPGNAQVHGCLEEPRCHLVDKYKISFNYFHLNVTRNSKGTTNNCGVGFAAGTSKQAGRFPLHQPRGRMLLVLFSLHASGYHASVYTIAAISVNVKKPLSTISSKYDRSQGRQKKNIFLSRICHLLVLQQEKTKSYRDTSKCHSKYHNTVLAIEKILRKKRAALITTPDA